MTPSHFSQQISEYAEFIAQKFGIRMSHDELAKIRHEAYISFASAESRHGRAKLDGLECVEWVKKYRNDNGSTLKAAKDEWDRLIAARQA